MPFVLHHAGSGQIYTCMLVNNYRLPYYGVKFWESEAEATEQASGFLTAQGIDDPAPWLVLELTEQQMKIGNVRLKNDPGLMLFWGSDGKPDIRKIPN
ncbi:hypothetical protein B5M42_002585 [Paenibacillus athensensis]|uniref:Uncharacterized protein n=1 Tax=Paenibacillus athensensis TaxID=1967502 RepID=A0A4Y8QA39_9BACL|nr:hypothetical protein [Paenibacillus athensensis]MCD1257726.1 hypothetical protein [Paenibacillus athensensis]